MGMEWLDYTFCVSARTIVFAFGVFCVASFVYGFLRAFLRDVLSGTGPER